MQETLFGQRLRQLREDLGMTQDDLAQAFSVHKSTISQYENAKREPEFKVVMAFAQFFGVSTDYMLGRTDARASADGLYQLSEAGDGVEAAPRGYYFNDLPKEDQIEILTLIKMKRERMRMQKEKQGRQSRHK